MFDEEFFVKSALGAKTVPLTVFPLLVNSNDVVL